MNTFAASPLAPVLAALPEFPRVGEVLSYQFTGLMVVFIALGLIWVMMEISGAFFKRHDARLAASRAKAAAASAAALTAASSTAAAVPATNSADEVPDAVTLALIVAAVHMTLGARPHRIVAITPTNAPLDWSREGRRDIFTSHRVR